MADPKTTGTPHYPSFFVPRIQRITNLSLSSSPGLSRPLLDDTLHLLTREPSQVTSTLCITTLLESLLAAVAVFLVLLRALVRSLSIFP